MPPAQSGKAVVIVVRVDPVAPRFDGQGGEKSVRDEIAGRATPRTEIAENVPVSFPRCDQHRVRLAAKKVAGGFVPRRGLQRHQRQEPQAHRRGLRERGAGSEVRPGYLATDGHAAAQPCPGEPATTIGSGNRSRLTASRTSPRDSSVTAPRSTASSGSPKITGAAPRWLL